MSLPESLPALLAASDRLCALVRRFGATRDQLDAVVELERAAAAVRDEVGTRETIPPEAELAAQGVARCQACRNEFRLERVTEGLCDECRPVVQRAEPVSRETEQGPTEVEGAPC